MEAGQREDAVASLVCFLLNTTRDFKTAFEAFGWSAKDEFLRNGVHAKIQRCRTCKMWRPLQDIARWPCPHCNHEQNPVDPDWALRAVFTLADSMFLKACGIACDHKQYSVVLIDDPREAEN